MDKLKKNPLYKELMRREVPNDFDYIIDKTYNFSKPFLDESRKNFDTYTAHDISHSERVLDIMSYLCANVITKLTSTEILFLIIVSLLHDVGMYVSDEEEKEIFKIDEVRKAYEEKLHQYKTSMDREANVVEARKYAIQEHVRSLHGARVHDVVLNDIEYSSILKSPSVEEVNFAAEVCLVCRSHSENIDWINQNLDEGAFVGEKVNLKYIALLLRIADYFDLDPRRAHRRLFYTKNLGRVSYKEWKKNLQITNDKKFDEENRQFFFNFSCDEFEVICDLEMLFESMEKELKSSIKESKKFASEHYHIDAVDEIKITNRSRKIRAFDSALSVDYFAVTRLFMGETLYGDKKLGLREIIQNSLDACMLKKQIMSSTSAAQVSPYLPKITIILDKSNETVSIFDNGIGMTNSVLKDYFFAVGKSYYRSPEFEKQGYEFYPNGTFGIGFLASFMLADKVRIKTKHDSESKLISLVFSEYNEKICECIGDSSAYLNHNSGTEIILPYSKIFELFLNDENLVSFIAKHFLDVDIPIEVIKKGDNNVIEILKPKQKKITDNLGKYLYGIEGECNYSLLRPVKVGESSVMQLIDENTLYVFCDSAAIKVVSKDWITVKLNQSENVQFINIENARNFQDMMWNFDIPEYEDYLYKVSDKINQLVEEWDIENGFSAMEDFRKNNIQLCMIFDEGVPENWIMTIFKVAWEISTMFPYELLDNLEDIDAYGIEKQRDDARENQRIYYRGVLLEEERMILPKIIEFTSDLSLRVNITSKEVVPNLKRTNLFGEAKDSMNYAINRSICLLLIDNLSEDEPLREEVVKVFNKEYLKVNSFCRE